MWRDKFRLAAGSRQTNLHGGRRSDATAPCLLHGQVWQTGTLEPTAWMFQQTGWVNRAGGAPALNGGSAILGKGGATASFADVPVRNVT